MNNKWFTLIEILLWILIFSIVIIRWFQALSSVNIWKIKQTEQTKILKEANYFIEKLFEDIKAGWTIDFEEYFNRKVVWTTTSSWHYTSKTWFWNFGSWWSIWSTNYWDNFYYCISWNWTNMWTWWCYNNNFNTYWTSLWNSPQRYWQYSFQFIDYNSNMNNDRWDEDDDWNIKWDDDDEHLWLWPIVFTWWQNVKELYLISWDWKKRTFFRWSWKIDPKAPNWALSCNNTTFWTWCIWTIEFLKLDWKDWGYNHSKSWTWNNDWIIDTWIIDPDFTWWWEIVAWSNNEDYRLPLFPDTLSVKNFEVYPYPNFDAKHMWKEASKDINPYVRIKLTLTPSWKKRWWMRWKLPEIDISTTINLAPYFSY